MSACVYVVVQYYPFYNIRLIITEVGDRVQSAEVVAVIVSSRSAFLDVSSAVDGTLERMLAVEGQTVIAGAPLLVLDCSKIEAWPVMVVSYILTK